MENMTTLEVVIFKTYDAIGVDKFDFYTRLCGSCADGIPGGCFGSDKSEGDKVKGMEEEIVKEFNCSAQILCELNVKEEYSDEG